MLKYGSCTIRGVAGARNTAPESRCPLDGMEKLHRNIMTIRTRLKKLVISLLPDFPEHGVRHSI
jgi:hypothetical protein